MKQSASDCYRCIHFSIPLPECTMKPLVFLLASVAMIVSGCASAPSADGSMSASEAMSILNRHQWKLDRATDSDGQYIQELFARRDKPLELTFQNDRVHVANACNVLNGNVTIEDGKLSVERMISTMMACADPAVSGLDRAISSRLEKPADFHIDTDATPPTLTLTTADQDTLVFAGTPPAADDGTH